jgi:tripartite-type tricarboxylate transporter receptor subunit TctC
VADNKPGATGIIGTEAVSRAAPDGHTLALVASSHAINPSTMKKLPFDTLKSFEPIVLTHIVPLMLVVAPNKMARMAWALLAHGAHIGRPSLRQLRKGLGNGRMWVSMCLHELQG